MTDDQMEDIKGFIGTAVAGLREDVQRNAAALTDFREETRTAVNGLGENVHRLGVVVEGQGTAIGELGENVHRLGVVVEGLRGDIRQVAEGHDVLRGEIADLRQETQEGFREIKTLLRISYADLDLKHADLAGRVERLEQGDDQP